MTAQPSAVQRRTLRAGKNSWSITDQGKDYAYTKCGLGAGKDGALQPDRKNALEAGLYYSKNNVGFFLEVIWRSESLGWKERKKEKKATEILK